MPLKAYPTSTKTLDSFCDRFLEENVGKLNADKFDLEFSVDPLFRRTSAKFDESAARGLLLNNLNVNRILKLEFSSSQDVFNECPKEHFFRRTKNFYRGIEDLGISQDLNQKSLSKMRLCEGMDNLIKDLATKITEFENMEKNTKPIEIIEDIPFEDPFYLNSPDHPTDEKVYFVEENLRGPSKSYQKKSFDKNLILEEEKPEKKKNHEKNSFTEELPEIFEPIDENLERKSAKSVKSVKSTKKAPEKALVLEGIEEKGNLLGHGLDQNISRKGRNKQKDMGDEFLEEEEDEDDDEVIKKRTTARRGGAVEEEPATLKKIPVSLAKKKRRKPSTSSRKSRYEPIEFDLEEEVMFFY